MKKNVQMNPIPTQQYQSKYLYGGSSKYLDDGTDRIIQSDHDLQNSQISYKDQHQSQPIEQFDDIQISKLPQLSEVINMKFRNEDKELHKQVIDIVRYAQNLENIVKYKNREIERLQYLIKYLTIAQQKRDEMLSHIQEENRKLKEQNAYLENVNKRPFQRSSISQSTNQLPSVQNQLKSQNQTPLAQNSPYQVLNSSNTQNLNYPLANNNSVQSTNKLSKKYSFLKPSARRSFMVNDEIKGDTDTPRRIKLKKKEGVDDRPQTILSLSLDADINKYYLEKEFVQSLSGIILEEDLFIQQVKQLEYLGMITLFDSIQKLMIEHKSLFYLVFRLRKLLKASITMNQSRIFSEALENIVEETCNCLESDRASVFIFEQESEQLWTKHAKGSNKTIKVPFDQGIVGAVFTSGQHLNILNAYNDERFNKEIDKMMNYKTNTVLAFPIFDRDGINVLGVIQSVNKLKGYFTKDDEGLMLVISQLASIVLRNSEQFDQTMLFQNNLRTLLQTGIQLSTCLNLEEFIPKAEKKLQDLFNSNKGKILIVDEQQKKLFSIHSDSKQKVYHELGVGIAGKTYELAETLNISNAYNHHLFNSEVDLDTSMPIISMPVKRDKGSNIIAILQVINQRGIQGLSSTNRSKVNSLDFESLEYFSQFLSQFLSNIDYLNQSKNKN
ncbi:GAF domain protein (macronuclear) [Tetrahymena thermophila SB210]|uniref:GAF domain protein n=1 Tax=Tetrahymena thermophila (strain SB210) TaxID=312017 RepID=Q22SL3_TETTS|nr:GAF domain protein [Tetrahymena thermophila SB210]EAR87759.3 GAF domain protein [Tetrahymena thermophila SB210]|eukprot:XP_001008004.3 GAF domain protein [Tetrahymena thermophila SB210]